jgi:hypothetical protein
MTHFSKAASILALAVLAVATQRAGADFVPWSYNWEPSSLFIHADGSTTAGLSLTNEPLKTAMGTSDVVVTNIRAFSTAPRNKPDHFTHAAYTFTMVLKDLLSGQSAVFKFGGFFSGTLSSTSANVTTTYTPQLAAGAILGGHLYLVKLGMYSPPGPPGAFNAGSISAHVDVAQFIPPPPPPPPKAPAPSSLVLSCVGLAGLGLVGLRKWYSTGVRG